LPEQKERDGEEGKLEKYFSEATRKGRGMRSALATGFAAALKLYGKPTPTLD